ncbi:MAG: helix-turn-helix domain-containing protein [Prevotella sp.]|nr:helix-turn-helix domain-containing protein [Prevotella sp.]
MKRTTLPNQNLLPVSHITRVIQDTEGYYWYATPGGGLCRDNGYQIDVIRNDRLHLGWIANNDIMGVCEDTLRKSILFTTWAGLYELRKRDYTLQLVSAIGSQASFDMAFDADGRLWVATMDSLLLLDKELKRLAAQRVPWSGGGVTGRFFRSADDRLWVVGGGRLWLADARRLIPVVLPEGEVVRCIVQLDRNGPYWVGTNRGIKAMDFSGGHRLERVVGTTGTDDGDVSRMEKDLNGRLWAVIDHRLKMFVVSGNQLIERDTESVFPEKSGLIDGFYVDYIGHIWVYGQTPHTFILSTYDRGIIDESARFSVMPRSIYCLMSSGPCLWAWQWQEPLVVINRQKGTVANVQEACKGVGTLGYGFSRQVGRSGIWDGTLDGEVLCLWMERGMVRHEIVAKVDSRVVATAETRDRKLWIGSQTSLYIYDLEVRKLKKIAPDIGCVTQMQIASDGWMYFTVEGKGLARANLHGLWEWVVKPMILTDVVEDVHHRIWTASKLGGVYLVDPIHKTLREDTLAGNENGDIIYMMEPDSTGHLWILSDQQLKEYNPETRAFRVLRCTDSDVRMDCFQNICLTDGKICLSGLGGYRLVKPSPQLDIRKNDRVVPALSGYRVNGKYYFVGQSQSELRLKPSDTNLELYFTSFQVLDRDRIQFACKLEGWDKDWKRLPQGVNSIQYINLQHGTYKLRLRAADAYGRWSESVALLTVCRLPSWYETWWMKVLMWGLAVVVFVSLIRYYMTWRFRRKTFLHIDDNQQRELLTLNTKEEEFLNKASRVVEDHISDTDFSVEVFSSQMCMSRMNLYRKLQALTGKSPSDYIRTIRLKKAIAIMRQEECPLNEISDRVGFSTPAYFSKCFRDMYGMSPTQWKQAHTFSNEKDKF